MAYDKQTWTNEGDGPPTPLNDERLNHIEDGIDDAHTLADTKAPLVHTHDDLTTDAELAAHAADADLHSGQHPGLAAHDTMGLATQAELDAHGHPTLAPAVHAHDPTTSQMGVAIHDANANHPRPTGYTSVFWIGSVEPVNAITNDLWHVR